MPAITIAVVGGVSTYLASRNQAKGNEKAAATQAASDDKALAQAKEIYETQRSDQVPYRQSGYGALDALNYGLGLPAVSRTAPAIPATSSMPTTADSGSSMNRLSGSVPDLTHAQHIMATRLGHPSATVKVQSPDGLVYLVPANRVSEAQSHGGQVIP